MSNRRRSEDESVELRIAARFARQSVKRIRRITEATIATGGLLLVVAVSIPWLHEPLSKIGITDGATVAQIVLTVVLVSLFFEVRELDERLSSELLTDRHIPDALGVYPALLKRMLEVEEQKNKVLDVIGITLFTAWPSIRILLARPEITGWTIRFAAFVGPDIPEGVPPNWKLDGQQNLNDILKYEDSKRLASRNIELRAFGYSFVPCVHGFRLRNGDLFISSVLWDDEIS